MLKMQITPVCESKKEHTPELYLFYYNGNYLYKHVAIINFYYGIDLVRRVQFRRLLRL